MAGAAAGSRPIPPVANQTGPGGGHGTWTRGYMGTWVCGHFSHAAFKNRDCSSFPEHETTSSIFTLILK